MREAPEKVKKAIPIALIRCGMQMKGDAAGLSPFKLGHLRGSISAKPYGDKKVIVGTNVIYAPIHEFGGEIRPKSKPYLTFKIGGQWVRVKSVKIKPKPYMTPAFERLIDGDAKKIFIEELQRAIKP